MIDLVHLPSVPDSFKGTGVGNRKLVGFWKSLESGSFSDGEFSRIVIEIVLREHHLSVSSLEKCLLVLVDVRSGDDQ